MRVKNKFVVIAAVPECLERCHVAILDTYFSKLPPEAFEKYNIYVQPLNRSTLDDPAKPWFTSRPIGRNTLNRMVKENFCKGNLAGTKQATVYAPQV